MKFTGKLMHQGDCQFAQIESLPSGLKRINKQFIAASERSGSFHALFGNYEQYETDDGFVLDVKEDCILNHSLQELLKDVSMDNAKVLPKKDHRHTVIEKGVYFVGIQTRFDPMEGIKKRVID